MMHDMPPTTAPKEQDRSVKGFWEPIKYRFQYLPVHIALLPTGKVLSFGGSCNDDTCLDTPHPAELFDPQTGKLSIVQQTLAGDLFCCGHSFLSDGRLLVAGGTHRYDGTLKLFGFPFPPFTGMEQTYLFDFVSEQWTRGPDMANGRWYPTLVTLGDGRVLTMAGLTKSFPWVFLRAIEIYSTESGWRRLEGADHWLPLYPRLHLLPDGNIFYSGSYNTHYTFPFSLCAFPTAILDVQKNRWRDLGMPKQSQREEGACVMLPLNPQEDYRAQVLLIGGGTPGGKCAEPDVESIDLSAASPCWKSVAPMTHARYYAYAVILPDHNVLVIGGRSGEKERHGAMQNMSMPDPGREPGHDPLAVLEPEMFNPESQRWSCMAPMSIDRLYHSNALLLPDGRVMVAGSNPARRVNELRIEIYHPPYLFRGERPNIEEAPQAIGYGEAFHIVTAHAEHIDQVALIRNSATTHCLNTDQRYVGLVFERLEARRLRAQLPSNRNLAPPGYYMLFVLSNGVPSTAKFVRVE